MKKSHIIVIAVIGVIFAIMIGISFIGPKEATLSDVLNDGNSITSGTFDIVINLSDNKNPNMQNLTAKINGNTDGVQTLFGITLETTGNIIEMKDLILLNNDDIYININSLSKIQGKNATFCEEDDLNKWIHIKPTNVSENPSFKELKTLFTQVISGAISSVDYNSNNSIYTINLNNEVLSNIFNAIADSIEGNTEQWTLVLENIFANSVEISDEIINDIITEENTTEENTTEEITTEDLNEEEIITDELLSEEIITENKQSEVAITEEETIVENEQFEVNVPEEETITTNEPEKTEETEIIENEMSKNNTLDITEKNEEILTEINEDETFETNTAEDELTTENKIENETTTTVDVPDFSFDVLNKPSSEKVAELIAFLRKLASEITSNTNIYSGTYSVSLTEEDARIFSQNISIKCNENTDTESSFVISILFTEKTGIELTKLSEEKILDEKKSSSVLSNFIVSLIFNLDNLFIPNYVETEVDNYKIYKNNYGVVFEETTNLFTNTTFYITTSGVVSDIYFAVNSADPIIRESFLDFYNNKKATEVTIEKIEKSPDKFSSKSLLALNYIFEKFNSNEHFLLMRADKNTINEYLNAVSTEDELIEYIESKTN